MVHEQYRNLSDYELNEFLSATRRAILKLNYFANTFAAYDTLNDLRLLEKEITAVIARRSFVMLSNG